MNRSLSLRLAERLNLRYPVLVVALGALTVIDILVPDFIPLVDEIGLLLVTLLASRWKQRRNTPPPAGPR
jgi:hypothetical protein